MDTFYLINQSPASSKLIDFIQSCNVVHHFCFFFKLMSDESTGFCVFLPNILQIFNVQDFECRENHLFNVKYNEMYVCLTQALIA